MNLTCEHLVQYLSDYIDGDLDEELREAAQRHLATCENCRVVLDTTQKTILFYREQGRQETIPMARREALFDRIAAAFAESQNTE